MTSPKNLREIAKKESENTVSGKTPQYREVKPLPLIYRTPE
jgi:hypothetical protein